MGFGITGESIKGVARAVLSSSQNDTEKLRADFVFAGRYVHTRCTDGGVAATAWTETVIYHAIVPSVVVKACSISLPVSVTVGATGVTFTLAKRTGGGGAVTIGSFNTVTGNQGALTAFIPGLMVLTSANVTLLQGDVLTLSVAKTGAGQPIAAATSDAFVEVQIEEST